MPVAWVPSPVRDCNQQDLCFRLSIDNQKRETGELDFAGSSKSTWPSGRSFEDSVDDSIYFVHESFRSHWAPLAVPMSRKDRLFDRSRVKNKLPLAHSNAEEILRRASSRDMGLTLPESISSMRRKTSASHAASTDASGASSRLSNSEFARSARSSTESVKAFFRSSRVSLLMFCIVTPKIGFNYAKNCGHLMTKGNLFRAISFRQNSRRPSSHVRQRRTNSEADSGGPTLLLLRVCRYKP